MNSITKKHCIYFISIFLGGIFLLDSSLADGMLQDKSNKVITNQNDKTVQPENTLNEIDIPLEIESKTNKENLPSASTSASASASASKIESSATDEVSSNQEILAKDGGIQDLLESDAFTIRCQEMLDKREKKYEFLKRLRALKERNIKIQKNIPPQKNSLIKTMAFTLTSLQNEVKLTEFKLTHLEETIIRSGCPGIPIK